ncbi:alanine racemase [Breoghania sp.]|uniref:alanine racemase n=1 Tax=Breoghania sp. TaxID=2065378 RepID=UPI002AA739E0|nr:alanine racemase [Breoghania sp.]
MSNAENDARLACSRLSIDLGALAHNWTYLASKAAKAECAAAIKGDGYGTGLAKAAEALFSAGCRTFFTAVPEEGLEARKAAPEARVFVLGGLLPDTAKRYHEAGLIPVLNCVAEIRDWAAYCASVGTPLPAAIHLDTGMNRMGLTLDEAKAVSADTNLLGRFEPVLMMSHLYCGGDPNTAVSERQLQRFKEITALFPDVPRSLANSAGIFLGPDYHFELVRPGISLYGGAAMDDGDNPMKPVATAEARILMLRDGFKGETIGYGASQTLTRDSRIAILGIGYADGYHRLAGTGGREGTASAWINGHTVPLMGRVSMDLIAVDVTDVPEANCKRGDWVEMFGPHISVDEVAAKAQTIGYELLTGLGRRYRRSYINAPQDAATN